MLYECNGICLFKEPALFSLCVVRMQWIPVLSVCCGASSVRERGCFSQGACPILLMCIGSAMER